MGAAAAALVRDRASLAVSAAGFVAGVRAAAERAR
jgi:hypothetical protein